MAEGDSSVMPARGPAACAISADAGGVSAGRGRMGGRTVALLHDGARESLADELFGARAKRRGAAQNHSQGGEVIVVHCGLLGKIKTGQGAGLGAKTRRKRIDDGNRPWPGQGRWAAPGVPR